MKKRETSEAVMNAINERADMLRKAFPDTSSALAAMRNAQERLEQLGWRQGIYCPKDGTEFAVIQSGSTGIFSAFYLGKWPDGHVMIADYLQHPDGIMWKALDCLSIDELVLLEKCIAAEKGSQAREIASMLNMTPDPE